MEQNTAYNPKPREEYIACCKYYTGEDAAACEEWLMAEYEKHWVDMHYDPEGVEELQRLVEAYNRFSAGLIPDDGTPVSLKALIWSRYMHWGSGYETPQDFINWWGMAYSH